MKNLSLLLIILSIAALSNQQAIRAALHTVADDCFDNNPQFLAYADIAVNGTTLRGVIHIGIDEALNQLGVARLRRKLLRSHRKLQAVNKRELQLTIDVSALANGVLDQAKIGACNSMVNSALAACNAQGVPIEITNCFKDKLADECVKQLTALVGRK